jgi:two-component system OmpR family sensor kinase
MHELKTPITKGKFLSELENSDENAEKMRRVFTRLELLISEFTQIEELISSTKNIVKNNYFLDDIIDNAEDMLMLEDDVIISEYENKKINVNFKLFLCSYKKPYR